MTFPSFITTPSLVTRRKTGDSYGFFTQFINFLFGSTNSWATLKGEHTHKPRLFYDPALGISLLPKNTNKKEPLRLSGNRLSGINTLVIWLNGIFISKYIVNAQNVIDHRMDDYLAVHQVTYVSA